MHRTTVQFGAQDTQTHLSPEQKGPFSEGPCALGLLPIGSKPSREPAGALGLASGNGPTSWSNSNEQIHVQGYNTA